MSHIFERQPTETDEAWAAFKAYRDQSNRNPKRVYVDGVRLCTETTQKYYNEYAWRDRVMAYDLHFDAIQLEAMEDSVRQIGRDAGKRITVALDDMLVWAEAELAKHKECALINDGQMSKMSEVVRVIDAAVKLKALQAGQPTEIVGAPTLDFTKMSPEEIETWVRLNEKAKKG